MGFLLFFFADGDEGEERMNGSGMFVNGSGAEECPQKCGPVAFWWTSDNWTAQGQRQCDKFAQLRCCAVVLGSSAIESGWKNEEDKSVGLLKKRNNFTGLYSVLMDVFISFFFICFNSHISTTFRNKLQSQCYSLSSLFIF